MDNALNQEITDIFIEEVADVQLLIEQHLPAWQHHGDDKLALQEIRRAFHTLKGSGKMVEAQTLAELGFAFEHALNQVIEGLQPVSAELQQLVDESLQLLPDALQDFVDHTNNHEQSCQALLVKLGQFQASPPEGPSLIAPTTNTNVQTEMPDQLLQRIEQLEQLLQKQQSQLRFYWLTPALCGLIFLAVIGQYFL